MPHSVFTLASELHALHLRWAEAALESGDLVTFQFHYTMCNNIKTYLSLTFPEATPRPFGTPRAATA